MELTFLGTGTALSRTRGWSSCIINNSCLFDAPPDVTQSLKRLNISVEEIEFIFITHFHADHYFGLPFILLEKFYFYNNDKPINIIGPKGIEEKIKILVKLAYEDVVDSNQNVFEVFNFIEITEMNKLKEYGLIADVQELKHTVPAFGYKVIIDNKVFTYTGDTGYCTQLENIVKGSDIVVAEMSNIENESDDHLNLKQLLNLSELLNSGGTFFATHIRNEVPSNIDKIVFSSDFKTYEL